MRVIVCEDYQKMSEAAARIVSSQVILKPDSILGLATGSTPVGMYNILSDMNACSELDFSEVSTFNLDEYYPLSAENDQSYRYFMNKNLFSKININIENTHVLNGLALDPQKECLDFEDMIDASGGIDLQILGIGQNGHIGFNEPGASLNSKTHLTDLTESTIKANSRFFESIEDVPTQALTMGIGTILKAKKIILLASGASKHRVVSELINGEINTDIPASMLRLHSDVVLICDKAAYSSDRIGIDIGGTDIKFGVMNDKNKIIFKDSVPTNRTSEDVLIDEITQKCKEIMKDYNITGVGVGTPGLIRDNRITASNLPFKNTHLDKRISDIINLPVSVANDANCAALGEATCGTGKDYKNLVMVTLGTGIGGGVVINNKVYQGRGSASEIGHICIEKDGKKCGCGQNGCWERYASISALVESAIDAANANHDSILYSIYKKNNRLSGRLIFEAIDANCPIALDVFDNYLDYLALGIQSLIYIFDPDVIVLSGGITNSGDAFLIPLLKKLNTDVPVMISSLKSDAGIYGAAMLQ